MNQIEINLFALDEEMTECGFESSDHLEWEDSLGRTVRLIPNFEMPNAGGVWCIAIDASHPAGVIAFAMAVRRLLPLDYVTEVPRTAHELGTPSRVGDTSVVYYFTSLALAEL